MLSCTTLGATNQIALEPDEGFDAVITERAAEEPEAKTPSPIGYVENGYGNPQKIDALSQSRRNMVSMNSRSQRGANIDIEDMNFSLAAVNPTVDDTGLLLPHWSSVEGSTPLPRMSFARVSCASMIFVKYSTGCAPETRTPLTKKPGVPVTPSPWAMAITS